jgi:hypothetical protein
MFIITSLVHNWTLQLHISILEVKISYSSIDANDNYNLNISGIQQNIRTGAIDAQHQLAYFRELDE